MAADDPSGGAFGPKRCLRKAPAFAAASGVELAGLSVVTGVVPAAGAAVGMPPPQSMGAAGVGVAPAVAAGVAGASVAPPPSWEPQETPGAVVGTAVPGDAVACAGVCDGGGVGACVFGAPQVTGAGVAELVGGGVAAAGVGVGVPGA